MHTRKNYAAKRLNKKCLFLLDHNGMKKEKIRNIIKSGVKYTDQNQAICFLPPRVIGSQKGSAGNSLLGKIQNVLKHYGKIYYALLYWFAPVLSSYANRNRLKKLLASYGKEDIILNLGSGPAHLYGRKDIINIDIFAFDEVDIVADAADLQIKDESVDCIINVAMLEHVHHPKRIVKEMRRILREGGEIFCYLPFMQPFHAAPDDFRRWTISGTRELFSEFKEVEVFIGAGPTSGFLWVFQEWLSILLSFGSKTLHDILFLAIMLLTWPIKFLDIFMVKLPYAENIASGFCVVARK